jgi:hypothetical protein
MSKPDLTRLTRSSASSWIFDIELKKKYFFSPQIHRQQDIPAHFCFLKKAKN